MTKEDLSIYIGPFQTEPLSHQQSKMVAKMLCEAYNKALDEAINKVDLIPDTYTYAAKSKDLESLKINYK